MGNWGVAIILLTVVIKLIFYPLSEASYRSMARMRVLAPKLQRLKEQYGDDKQRMQQAMMELYKTEKINPLGGCLPIVVQIPVFIALYWVLLASVELRHAPFMLWIHDLSRPDPWFILPVLMGATMIIQTRLNPEPPDPVQAKVMKIMPIAFSVFFFFFLAGHPPTREGVARAQGIRPLPADPTPCAGAACPADALRPPPSWPRAKP